MNHPSAHAQSGIRRQITKAVAMLAVLMLVLVACGGEDAEDEDEVTDDTADSAETDEEGQADPDDSAPDEASSLGGSIVWPNAISVDNLDPDQNSQGFPLPMLIPAYDRLVHMQPDTGELVPGLAESWEYSDDGNVLELRLREGVLFHDGTPFNAEAAAANLDRSQSLPEVHPDVQGQVAAIGSVEVIDEHVIRLTKAEGMDLDWSLLLPRLTENIGMMISPDAFENPDLDRAPVGAGPYKFVDFTGDDVRYERFSDYWDADVAVAESVTILQPVDPEALLTALTSGDITIGQLQPEQVDAAEAAGLEVVVQDTLVVWHLYMNHSREPLTDTAVRQAISYALDREAIVDVLTQGTGSATAQTFPPGYIAYNPDHDIDRYAYDPDRARSLLDDAGYSDGITLNFELLNRPDIVQLAEAMQAQLADVGITLELDVVEIAARGGYLAGDYDLILGPRSRLDPLQILSEVVDEDGSFNPGGYTTDEVQALVDEAGSLPPDSDERLTLVQELSGLVAEESWLITVYSEASIWAHDPCLTGFQYPIQTYVDFKQAGLADDC